MTRIGIIADTHVTEIFELEKKDKLLAEIHKAFKGVDEIIHAGDVCLESFLEELKKIAPTKCVKGNMDNLDLEKYISFSIGKYNIGVIHKPPKDLESFFKEKDLHILIHGHTHQPLIKGTPYNTLIINPGSPTHPKAPPKKFMFKEPQARPSVITLEIDEDDMLKTFVINLKI